MPTFLFQNKDRRWNLVDEEHGFNLTNTDKAAVITGYRANWELFYPTQPCPEIQEVAAAPKPKREAKPAPATPVSIPLYRPEPSVAQTRKYDASTSAYAAAMVNVESDEWKVTQALAELGEAHNEDIANFLGKPQAGSVSPRIKPLREKGLVVYAGYTKKSSSNCPMKVWKLRYPGAEKVDPASCEKTFIVDNDREIPRQG